MIFFTNEKIWQISALASKEWPDPKKKAFYYIKDLSTIFVGKKIYSENIWTLATVLMTVSSNLGWAAVKGDSVRPNFMASLKTAFFLSRNDT